MYLNKNFFKNNLQNQKLFVHLIYQNIKTMEKLINEAIETAKLEYKSDISWNYTNTVYKDKISIMFGTDSVGRNEVNEFCVRQGNKWVEIDPTDKQLKRIFEILNKTPYREVEKEVESPWVSEDFDYYGRGYKGDYGL